MTMPPNHSIQRIGASHLAHYQSRVSGGWLRSLTSLLGVMDFLLNPLVLVALALSHCGCMVACGPGRHPPPQKLQIVAQSPSAYTVRVFPTHTYPNEAVDTPVPSTGRVQFDVPINTPYCKQYLFGVIRLNPDGRPEAKRRIRVREGDVTIRKLSADDISRLPADAEGYHRLEVQR